MSPLAALRASDLQSGKGRSWRPRRPQLSLSTPIDSTRGGGSWFCRGGRGHEEDVRVRLQRARPDYPTQEVMQSERLRGISRDTFAREAFGAWVASVVRPVPHLSSTPGAPGGSRAVSCTSQNLGMDKAAETPGVLPGRAAGGSVLLAGRLLREKTVGVRATFSSSTSSPAGDARRPAGWKFVHKDRGLRDRAKGDAGVGGGVTRCFRGLRGVGPGRGQGWAPKVRSCSASAL